MVKIMHVCCFWPLFQLPAISNKTTTSYDLLIYLFFVFKTSNHEISNFFIQFFFQVPEKTSSTSRSHEIWFQFGAALQFEGGGGLEAAAAYK